MPLAGLLLNRVQRSPAARLSAARSQAAAETLQAAGSHPLAVTALRLHADRMQLVSAQRRLAKHFTAAHPIVPVAEIPAQPQDVHDLEGLRAIGQAFGN
jgi:hypothetical protein